MDKNKGAMSFSKTIEGYINAGWNVTLINPDYNVGITPDINRLNIIRYNQFFIDYVKLNM